MSLTLSCLALNPNISPAQFEELAKKHTDARALVMERMGEQMERLPIEGRIQFLQFMLPILLTW